MFGAFGNWGITPLSLPLPSEPVTTFFVISGFLITYLLLHELKKTDDVSIPKFYVRRILRIWPLYYGYMIVAIVAYWMLGSWLNGAEGGGYAAQFAGNSKWFYWLFTANIPFAAAAGILPIVHYWSLGVEEQFYAWYPWVVKYGKNRLLPIIVTICLVWLTAKLGAYVFLGKGLVYRLLAVTRFDCMMIGGIGAIMYFRNVRWFHAVIEKRWIRVLLWILFFSSGLYADFIPAPLRATYISFISLGVIVSGLIGKPLLENKVMNYLGNISYGIYVIHPLFIILGSHFLGGWLSSVDTRWLWIVYIGLYVGMTILTIGLAALSYELYEKPFLKLKTKFMVVKSSNKKEE